MSLPTSHLLGATRLGKDRVVTGTGTSRSAWERYAWVAGILFVLALVADFAVASVKARARDHRFRSVVVLTIVLVLSCLVSVLSTAKAYSFGVSDRGVSNYGDAAFYGSTGGTTLNKPIVGMAATPDGKGYWLVASDGGIFTYGGISTDAGMSPPPGYTSQQMIFDDQFSGTSLDTTKWNTFIGAQGIVWNNNGSLPLPYSAPNASGTEAAMFGPSQVSVNNGLTLTAQRNTNQYAGTYPWISGVVTTEGKFSLPTSGWYVQVKVKMPDQSKGMWPAIWFLPGVSGTPVNEFDGYEGGAPVADPNQLGVSNYFTNQGLKNRLWNTDVDVTAGYNIYGFQFIPGHSITVFFDGTQVWQLDASNGVTITAEPYEIILQLEVASENASYWHTVTNANTPTSSMEVAEVQVYSTR